MKIAVSTASGVEAVTKRELFKLGIPDAPALNGRIVFEGNESTIIDCNLFLRTANRVLIVLGEFSASNFDELFENIYAIDWNSYLPIDAKLDIEAKSVQSKLYALSATQSIAKKAICEKLMSKNKYAVLSESGDRYRIEISLFRDFCTVSLDTSGDGLHKRGYRKLVGTAPLKETLASAMLELSVWNRQRPFCDIFCGTGTLCIEAARIALNMPNASRDFDFMHWKKFNFSNYEKVKSEAIARLTPENMPKISGFDIDDKQLELSRAHAKAAGVDEYIHFQKADMRDFSTHYNRGVIISNPPYGERLSDRAEIENLYRDYGRVAKKFSDWCFYTLTPVTDFERLFGKKADKKRKLYNGNIECFYYSHLSPKPSDTKN